MTTCQQLEARNKLVDWQLAPAEWQIVHYDQVKVDHRHFVQSFIESFSNKSIRKRTFCTIVTNVLCADIFSKDDSIDPIDRDIYLPLEISITKWTISNAMNLKQDGKVPLNTRVWMVNPGAPTRKSVCAANDHRKNHKIEFDTDTNAPNPYVEKDLNKLMKEINDFLTPDRLLFSQSLRHIRQDLGAIKWLNRETGYKIKPVKIYSLEDLYVVLIRHMNPDLKDAIGLGIAEYRLKQAAYSFDTSVQCVYHQAKAKNEDGHSGYCAKELSQSYSTMLIQDVIKFGIELGEDS